MEATIDLSRQDGFGRIVLDSLSVDAPASISTVDPQSALGAALTIDADGRIVFDFTGLAAIESLADGETLSDSFNYTVDDGAGAVTPVAVTATIAGATAMPDAATSSEDGSVQIDVLDNDNSADGASLSLLVLGGARAAVGETVELASGATVTLTTSGEVIYDANGAFESLGSGDQGADSFKYRLLETTPTTPDPIADPFDSRVRFIDLDGANGFRIDGIARDDFTGRVSSAGDLNGDGIEDILIGASGVDVNGEGNAGAAYVVFGTDDGYDAVLPLSGLDGSNGFRIEGVTGGDRAGQDVDLLGDINGDGIDDIIIGAYQGDPNGVSNAGESYVLFGSKDGFAATLSLADLDGSNGFRLDGVGQNDDSGQTVFAGDVNGDGINDLIIGAPGANGGAGATYVVFGTLDGYPATVALADLDGDNGFRLDGVDTTEGVGRAVSTGDVNADGFDDVIIGAPFFDADPSENTNNGRVYVVFGAASGFAASQSLADLDGADGFRIDGFADSSDIINGDAVGRSVAAVDVNADGFDDIIVGVPGGDPDSGASDAGEVFVIFGAASGFGATVSLESIDGSNGFRLDGIGLSDDAGSSVASAGDYNGDGYEDFLVGAPGRPSGSLSGETFLVFGTPDGFPAVIDLSSLDGATGVKLIANDSAGFSGSTNSISAADVNDDGFDDVIVGAASSDTNNPSRRGEVFVIFGGSDIENASGFAEVTVTVDGENDAPVATDPSVTFSNVSDDEVFTRRLVAEASAETDLAISLLATDIDSELTAQSFNITSVIVNNVTADSVAAAGVSYDPLTGDFTFDPTGVAAIQALGQGESALVQILFEVVDGDGGSDQGSFFIEVVEANDGPVVTDPAPSFPAVSEDDTITRTLTVAATESTDLAIADLATDIDSTLTPASFTFTSATIDGAPVTIAGAGVSYVPTTGLFTFDPSSVPSLQALAVGSSAQVVVNYTVSDGEDSATGALTFEVTGVNDAPVASGVSSSFDTTEDEVLTVEIALLSDEAGQVPISDLATDIDSVLTPASVSFDSATIDGDPVATLDEVGVSYDAGTGAFVFDPTGVAAFQALGVGDTAQLVVAATVSDEAGGSSNYSFVVDVSGANDAPEVADPAPSFPILAGDEVFTRQLVTEASQPTELSISDLVADVDSTLSAASFAFESVTIGGESVPFAAAGFSYDADTGVLTLDPTAVPAFQALGAGETLEVVASYTVSDSDGGSAPGALTFLVGDDNDAPVVTDPAPTFAAITEDEVFTRQLVVDASGPTELAIADLATDVDSTLSASSFSFDSVSIGGVTTGLSKAGITYDPTTGTLTFDPTNALAFQVLGAGDTSEVVLAYTVSDDAGDSAPGALTFQVTGVNDAPETAGPSLGFPAVSEDEVFERRLVTSASEPTDISVVDIAFDIDSTLSPSSFTFESVSINGAPGVSLAAAGVSYDPTTGAFVFDPTGVAAFQALSGGETAAVLVSYTVDDGEGGSAPGAFALEVVGSNDGPVAAPDTAATVENIAVTVAVVDNDEDAEEDALTPVSVTQGDNGAVVINEDGTLTYTPNEGYFGDDSFTYAVTDGGDAPTTATVTVSVAEAQDLLLEGSSEVETLSGASGDDTLIGRGRQDTLDAGAGLDELRGNGGGDLLQGGAGDDTLQGGRGKDTLEAGDGQDEMRGGGGGDLLQGGAGDDTMKGGRGQDTLEGGVGDDELRGSRGADSVSGGEGADNLRGGRGGDTLEGGAGDDTLTGRKGSDLFVFDPTDGSVDTVTDFDVDRDLIGLSGEVTFEDLLIVNNETDDAVLSVIDGAVFAILQDTDAEDLIADLFVAI